MLSKHTYSGVSVALFAAYVELITFLLTISVMNKEYAIISI